MPARSERSERRKKNKPAILQKIFNFFLQNCIRRVSATAIKPWVSISKSNLLNNKINFYPSPLIPRPKGAGFIETFKSICAYSGKRRNLCHTHSTDNIAILDRHICLQFSKKADGISCNYQSLGSPFYCRFCHFYRFYCFSWYITLICTFKLTIPELMSICKQKHSLAGFCPL